MLDPIIALGTAVVITIILVILLWPERGLLPMVSNNEGFSPEYFWRLGRPFQKRSWCN